MKVEHFKVVAVTVMHGSKSRYTSKSHSPKNMYLSQVIHLSSIVPAYFSHDLRKEEKPRVSQVVGLYIFVALLLFAALVHGPELGK